MRGQLFEVGGSNNVFLQMIGGLNGGYTVNAADFPMSSDWTLDAGAQPAITETGSLTAPANNNYTRNQNLNTTQIYMESIYVSYAKLSTPGAILTDLSNGLAAAGGNQVQNEVDFQIMASLKQMARDVNYTFINGTYVQATDASTAAKTGGMIEGITTYSGIGTGGSSALQKEDINNLLINMAEGGAPMDNMVAICPAVQKVALSTLYGVQPRDWNVGGVDITRIETDFGPIGVVFDADVPVDTILFADMAHIKPVFCPVPGKGVLFYEELARTGAGVKGQMYAQIGLDYGPRRVSWGTRVH